MNPPHVFSNVDFTNEGLRVCVLWQIFARGQWLSGVIILGQLKHLKKKIRLQS